MWRHMESARSAIATLLTESRASAASAASASASAAEAEARAERNAAAAVAAAEGRARAEAARDALSARLGEALSALNMGPPSAAASPFPLPEPQPKAAPPTVATPVSARAMAPPAEADDCWYSELPRLERRAPFLPRRDSTYIYHMSISIGGHVTF